VAEDVWTVKRILDWIEGYLAQHGDENPRVSAQWLVGEALGVSRMQLFLDAERPLTADERAVLRDWTRRRGAGEPLQYITGEAAFRHITVKVRPGVLIPRPETEVLVSEALALLPAAPKPQDALDAEVLRQYAELTSEKDPVGALSERPAQLAAQPDGRYTSDAATATMLASLAGRSESAPTGVIGDVAPFPRAGVDGDVAPFPRAGVDGDGSPFPRAGVIGDGAPLLLVADICTGSGCIACSIASEHPRTRLISTDISSDAVALARENVERLGLDGRVDVIQCDLAEGIDDALLGSFDLVVSNPPYVPTDVLAVIPGEVAEFEPALALDGGPDGLAVYRRLLDWCARALKPGGALAFELHETCLEDAAAEAEYAGFVDVRIVEDLAGRPRVLTARTRKGASV